MSKLRVAVLMGGRSSEREVSLKSGNMVLRHLDPAKYDALGFDTGSLHRIEGGAPAGSLPAGPTEADLTALAPLVPRAIKPNSTEPAVDVAFIALHGRGGEDGAIQGLLELLGIPYTGSGVLASALAMDKVAAKRIFRAEGIPTPQWRDFWMDNCVDPRSIAAEIESALGLPAVIKPACEGSTIGITIARRGDELPAALETAAKYGPHVLAEQFVGGTEITAGMLGNRSPQVLPLVEIVPEGGFYDYHAKYTPGATEEIVPARVSDDVARRAREAALGAFEALGCRGVARVDMIAGTEGPVVLEVNTVPGLTETSLVPRAAEAAGMSFGDLLDRIIELALEER
ncbi:MAG: D-alanine--D-alanine ligase [Armatimonadota bacterium]|nr:MAG: D-alanine--D-alanine ligase [Armatimonadota bacterium]